MSGSRILWGQITLVLAVVLATTWIATQWTAWRLGFQPQLGQPWFELAQGAPVYYPPAFFWWWYAYDAYAPSVFIEGAFIAASGGFIAIAVAITMSILRARECITTTPEVKEHLWSALTSLASAPVMERTLTGLSVLLQSQALKRALQPYCI